MLSLILSVRQLRQPSGLTELSRFGSRDLGPAANQHSRVWSTPMPNQIQSGDPISQAPFICKAPRNQGSLLSDLPDVCAKSASAAGAWDMFEIEMHCDSPRSSVAQWRGERERERSPLSPSNVASNAGYADVKIVPQICVHPPLQKE